MAIILDLETVAIDGAEALTEPVSAPANYKDPQKIADYIAKAQAEQTSKAALHPWTARIVAIGVALEDGTDTVATCENEQEEAAALKDLAALVWRDDDRFVRPIVGFKHRTFDLPVALARSILLGVKFPALNLDRYRTPHTDLMDKLTWYDTVPARSLKWYCRRFGIPVDDTVSGADIAALVKAGDWAAVRSHCLSDVKLTKALAERIGVIRGGKVAA